MAGPVRVWGRRLAYGALLAIGAALGLVCGGSVLDGPLGPLPGGALRGSDEPCPIPSWRDFAWVEEWEVEVRPERPRSVTTWSVVHNGTLYLPADFLTPGKRWPHQVMADPRIRLRSAGEGGRIFRCRAERVDDPDEIEALRHAIAAKYELDAEGLAAQAEVWWFRVVPR